MKAHGRKKPDNPCTQLNGKDKTNLAETAASEGIACFIHSHHPLALRALQQAICSDKDIHNCINLYSRDMKSLPGTNCAILVLDTCSVDDWQNLMREWQSEGGRTIGIIAPNDQRDALELEMLYLGAMGILVFSDDAVHELPKIIHTVLEGKIWARRHIMSEYVRRTNLLLNRFSTQDSCFTAREHQIIELLRQGYSNKQIGNVFEICERTAKFHVSNILRKCNLQNRRDLLAMNFKISRLEVTPLAVE